MTSQERFLRLPDLRRKVGLSRSQIYRLISRGEFPPQRKVGSKVSVWAESEIDEWMAEQQPFSDTSE
jgi:prophage regulatory protein